MFQRYAGDREGETARIRPDAPHDQRGGAAIGRQSRPRQGEDGEHAPVHVASRLQAELAEHRRRSRLDGLLADGELGRDRGVLPALGHQSRIWRSRSVSAAIGLWAPLVVKLPPAQIDWLVTGGSRAVRADGGAAINGWVVLAATSDWPLTAEARSYVESLKR
jgi:hypothetical protein